MTQAAGQKIVQEFFVEKIFIHVVSFVVIRWQSPKKKLSENYLEKESHLQRNVCSTMTAAAKKKLVQKSFEVKILVGSGTFVEI